MQTRLFSLFLGVVYIVVGIAGFIPALYTSPAANAPHLSVTASYGYLLSLFPVNAVHDVLHLLIGLAGVAASRRLASARYYCIALFVLYGLFTIAGFIPQFDTLFGLAPIFGDDTWLHAGSALLAGYFGFVAPEPTRLEGHVPAAAH